MRLAVPELLYSSNNQPFSIFDYEHEHEHHFIEHEHEWKPARMVFARHKSLVCPRNSSHVGEPRTGVCGWGCRAWLLVSRDAAKSRRETPALAIGCWPLSPWA